MGDWSAVLDDLSRGELSAFDRVTRLVTGYLARIGAYQHRDSWDDLVQEVLMALLANPPTSREPGAVVRHIQTTTYRKFVDEVRRQRGRRRVGAGEDTAEPGTGETGWRRSVSLDEVPELDDADGPPPLDLGLQKAVSSLPERERQAVECRYVLGCSNDEGAERLGVSLATYKRALTSAMQSLRDRLVPGGADG